jgi:5-formyltetrahydrofolate cyclo-ligase
MSSVARPPAGRTAPQDPEDSKEELRHVIRAARATRPERQRALAAQALADVVLTIPEVEAARCVAAYTSRPTEPGTGPLLERLAARGVRVLLPVLGTGLQRGWAEYAGGADLQVRAPGRPPEPGTPDLGARALADADVVLAPALSVDASGMRLGQGGGWYDRALEHARPGVLVVALTFAEEAGRAEPPLPREAHDRTVGAWATPEGWRDLRATGAG